jgi:hypothetical protein
MAHAFAWPVSIHYSLNHHDWFRDGHMTQTSPLMGILLPIRGERTSFLDGFETENK